MKRKSYFIFILLLLHSEHGNGIRLKKVLILSRHGVRAPLSENIEVLSHKGWPKWSAKPGDLTPRGVRLESYMGQYFAEWFHEKGLFQNRCPESGSVNIHSNYLNRTRGSAKAFSEAAFPDCNVKIHFKNVTFPNPQYDAVFPYIISNASDAFIQRGTQEMQENLKRTTFTDVYAKLNNISDIRHSKVCQINSFCDLEDGNEEVSFKYGEFPCVLGRFMIASSLVDSFLMGFYEGFPINEVGWGSIESEDLWKLITTIANENLKICYHLTVMRDFVRPLVKYMKKALEDETLFTLIVGHDSNLTPLMYTMGFNSYVLPEQYEYIPIGSKLVFQKWSDGVNDFLKVEYVYQSWGQIREAEKLSLSNPPKNITMYFKTRTADEDGMYAWSDFENMLDDLTR